MQNYTVHGSKTNTRRLMINGNDFPISPAISSSSWENNGHILISDVRCTAYNVQHDHFPFAMLRDGNGNQYETVNYGSTQKFGAGANPGQICPLGSMWPTTPATAALSNGNFITASIAWRTAPCITTGNIELFTGNTLNGYMIGNENQQANGIYTYPQPYSLSALATPDNYAIIAYAQHRLSYTTRPCAGIGTYDSHAHEVNVVLYYTNGNSKFSVSNEHINSIVLSQSPGYPYQENLGMTPAYITSTGMACLPNGPHPFSFITAYYLTNTASLTAQLCSVDSTIYCDGQELFHEPLSGSRIEIKTSSDSTYSIITWISADSNFNEQVHIKFYSTSHCITKQVSMDDQTQQYSNTNIAVALLSDKVTTVVAWQRCDAKTLANCNFYTQHYQNGQAVFSTPVSLKEVYGFNDDCDIFLNTPNSLSISQLNNNGLLVHWATKDGGVYTIYGNPVYASQERGSSPSENSSISSKSDEYIRIILGICAILIMVKGLSLLLKLKNNTITKEEKSAEIELKNNFGNACNFGFTQTTSLVQHAEQQNLLPKKTDYGSNNGIVFKV